MSTPLDRYNEGLALVNSYPDSYQAKQDARAMLKAQYEAAQAAMAPAVQAIQAPPGFQQVPFGVNVNAKGQPSTLSRFVADDQMAAEAAQRKAATVDSYMKQADALAAATQIPYRMPDKTDMQTIIDYDADGKKKLSSHQVPLTIPGSIAYRPGKVSDFTAGSNPYNTYTMPVISASAPLPQPNATAVPAMYVGEGLPPVPFHDPSDYLQVLNARSQAMGQPPVDIERARAAMQAPAIAVDPSMPDLSSQGAAGYAAGVRPPVQDIGALPDFSGQLDTLGTAVPVDAIPAATPAPRVLDQGSAVQFLRSAGGDREKARQLARDAGFSF